MSQTPHSTTILGQLQYVLVIGDEAFNEEVGVAQMVASDGLETFFFKNPFKAFRWLEEQIPAHLPQGILCQWSFLEQEGFHLIDSLHSRAGFRDIPFICLASPEELQHIDIQAALKRGVDDCFTTPLDWNKLEFRLRSLRKVKSIIHEISQEPAVEFFNYKTPLPKRIFDIVFAGLVILALSPLLIFIALAVRFTSSGPIIYRSKRVGTGYEVFDFLKFRSMYKDADKRLAEYQHLNQYKSENENLFVKINNDPRVTWIGRIIRKTSLDELPQLFNVLLGDMSIVGNRPLPLYEADQLTRDEWAKRFLAPAGITGLWQVTKRGKNDMSTQERLYLDIAYAENYSFWYDLKIIAKTIPAMIQEENV